MAVCLFGSSFSATAVAQNATTPGGSNGGTAAAKAAAVTKPEVYKMMGRNQRVDTNVDELRADLVLKVPHGTVDSSGNLKKGPNGNALLHVGYDYTTVPSDRNYRNMTYINTMTGKSGADAWANNQDEYFTIHSIIVSGSIDYLVMSVEGDLNIIDYYAQFNQLGGVPRVGNWYFSLADTPGANSGTWQTDWISNSTWSPTLTTYAASYQVYPYIHSWGDSDYVAGPIAQVQFDNTDFLYNYRQAQWGQALDFGVGNAPAGVLPVNSVAIDPINPAFKGTSSGSKNSVTKSFWYAWVTADGRLATAINSAPIHIVGGFTPHADVWSYNSANIVKNGTGVASSTLAWTADQGAQGLQNNSVSTSGQIDFKPQLQTDTNDPTQKTAGYYRLLVWPETSDPTTVVRNPSGDMQTFQYTKDDLFQNNQMTSTASTWAWTVASVFYGFQIKLPDPPVITSPSGVASYDQNGCIPVTGTGTPGDTITLKWLPGVTLPDVNAANVQTLVNGEVPDSQASTAAVTVGSDGKWSYSDCRTGTFVEGAAYSLRALQTEHTTGYALTSQPSALATYVFSTSVKIQGDVTVADVTNSAPSLLPSVDSSNWEVIATADNGTASVISGNAGFSLKRGSTYTISERLRSNPQPDARAQLYAQQSLQCTDANGAALPAGVFDKNKQTLTIGTQIQVSDPILCHVVMQTSQVSFVVKLPSGTMAVPAGKWSMTVTGANGASTTTLNNGKTVAEILPGSANLSAVVPDGLGVQQIQKLDLSNASCAKLVNDINGLKGAPESCWIATSGTANSGVFSDAVVQGQQNIYRVVAAAPGALPEAGAIPWLRLLGWIFLVFGAGALIVVSDARLRKLAGKKFKQHFRS